MLEETKDIVFANIDFLPLKSYTNIVEGNALEIDWESVVPKDKLNYIIGNPPFLGYSLQSPKQKSDLLNIYVDENGKPYKTAGKIDFVSAWYFKASQLMCGTSIRTALVSTNSITQGEQVASVWKPLYERFGIHIDFAYRTFKWNSEAKNKAAVHCVIIGFSVSDNSKNKVIYDNETKIIAQQINPYLIDGDIIFIDSRSKSICKVLPMVYGSKPTDGGYLFLNSKEKDEIVSKYPVTESMIRRVYGASEFINNKTRYCLWLIGHSPKTLRSIPPILNRIQSVKEFRQSSPKKQTRESAERATEFQEIRHNDNDYLLIPSVSSENRRYIPIGFMSGCAISTNANLVIPDATLYDFGILISNVHMAWMRTVAGRLKSDYRYSAKIVYNNFPWPEVTDAQKEKISKTAQGILDARALYPDSSLADLYDELTMPKELRRAHQANDKAVMEAYGLTKIVDGKKTWLTESETVARLFELYEQLTNSKS